ncbi:MAG: 23S rRNA (adenine(2503)-C(2))-methyltransferase RlmN [Acidimicrobiia bacterium]
MTRYAIRREVLDAMIAEWNEPAYRATQIWEALFAQRIPLEAATNLPARIIEHCAHELPPALTAVVHHVAADAMTAKWLWRTHDGAEVETVLMRSPDRATVCVSSQAGCAMACTFCATGQAGFERHLSAGEIVEQVARAQHFTDQRVSNVVYMGMGEPLANFEPVWESVEILHERFGCSARHLTISTVGVVPGMRRLAEAPLPVTLAVSLHAPDDELRATLVPLNHRYPIAEVLDAAAEVARAHGRRVTFEYAAIDHINDELHHADALARVLTAFPNGAHVNAIPLNPTAGFVGHAPDTERIHAFAERLRTRGTNATVRRNRGVDIDAACGQLRARHQSGAVIPPTSA